VDGISPGITGGREAENKKRNTQSSYKSKHANDAGKSKQPQTRLTHAETGRR